MKKLEMSDLKNLHSMNTKIVKIGLGESFIESLLKIVTKMDLQNELVAL